MKLIIKNNLNIFIVCSILIIFGIILRTKILLANVEPYNDAIALGCSILKPFSELFKPLDHGQVAPPFFMVLSKLMVNIFHAQNTLEYKDFILRIIPYISGILSLPLFSYLIHKMFNNKYFTLICSFLLLFNLNFIFYSSEFKQYSTEACVSLIILCIFYFNDFNNINLKKLFFISLFLSFLIWISPISIIIIIPGIISFLIPMFINKKIDKKRIYLFILPILFNCLLFYLFYYRFIHSFHYEYMKIVWMDNFFNINNVTELFKNELIKLFNVHLNINNITFYIFFFFNLYILLSKRNYKIICLCFIPILLFTIICFFKMYPFGTRLILFLLPLFIILFCQIILLLKENKFIIILLEIILIYNGYLNISAPIEEYNIFKPAHKIRTMYKQLKKVNPELKNVIGSNAYFQYYSGKKLYLDDNPFKSFELSNIPETLKKSKEKDFWFFIPSSLIYFNYTDELIKYIQNNKEYKLIYFYQYPKENEIIFIAHIQKK